MNTSTTPTLLLCDAPTLALEELLPLFRGLGYNCIYVQEIEDLRPEFAHPDGLVICAEIEGGPGGAPLRRLKHMFPGIPIFVVAHVRSLSTAIEFFRQGVTDYLPAPLRAEETGRRLRQALAQRETAAPPVVEVAAETEPADGGGTERNGRVDLDWIPCGVLHFREDGALCGANAAALSLLGQPDAETLAEAMRNGMDRFALLDAKGHPLAPEAWPLFRARREKAPRAAVVSLRRPDRTRVWLQVEARPEILGGRVRSLTATLTNITEAVDRGTPGAPEPGSPR